MMNPRVTELIPELSASVEKIMSPLTSPDERQMAHEAIEDFKDCSPLCIPCGFALSQVGVAPVLRHFGFQLIEHSIKFKWNTFTEQEKFELKRRSLDLIVKGSIGILEEEYYMKDAISRVVVEVIKHEWPSKWRSLLHDLFNISQRGPTQTELVLKVYQRLAEDVLMFQNVPQFRRKEIMNGLSTNMKELCDWFIALLREHSTKALALFQEDTVASQGHLKVSAAVMETLCGFADSPTMSGLLIQDTTLQEILCTLLGNCELQLHAAEVLLMMLNRKGRPDERMPLMFLFSEGAMSRIWNAAIVADAAASSDEHFYLFLKRLCQVITELGKTLHYLWGSAANVSQPPNFDKFLEALLAFSEHSSQMLSYISQSVWSMYLRHEQISEDPIFVSYIPRVIGIAKKKLGKVGYPSQNNSVSCAYSRLEFDSDEEFNGFFSKYRSEILETMRAATTKSPDIAFNLGSQWVQHILEQPLDIGEDPDGSGICNLSSPFYVEWDGLSVYLEAVMTRLNVTSDTSPEAVEGIALLKACLKYETQDPLILSSLLSCISALCIFLKYTPEILTDILKKIFSAVVFEMAGQTKGKRSKAVKNVRQHACSGLVKMCTKYHELIFPIFDELYDHIKTISVDPEQLSQMEKCVLTEALILISNHFNDYEKEAAFIGEVMKPVKDLWLSDDFKAALWDPRKFMSYIGLDQPGVEPSGDDTSGINRSHIMYCVNLILAVMKRSMWPEDTEEAKTGGFVISKRETGGYVMRNPATSHISILLENVLALIKTMNMLYDEECLKFRHKDFEKSYDLMAKEKHVILGIPSPVVDMTGNILNRKPKERMQHFLVSCHELCCHILGNAGVCLGEEFYTIPNLADSVVKTVLCGLDQLPEYKMRPLIRLKHYVQNCPQEHYSTAVLPVLAHLCPYMHQRLSAKWQLINLKYPLGQEAEEENQESEEVFQEMMTRLVTKEYLELITYLLVGRKQHDLALSDDKMDDGEGGIQSMPHHDITIGKLGLLCFSEDAIYQSIVLSLFNGLSWNDTVICLKCMRLCGPLLKQMLELGKMTSAAAAELFKCVLIGLQQHGQHDLSQPLLIALGVLTYELLKPTYTNGIDEMMLQIPSCTKLALKQYDEKYLGAAVQQRGHEKKKKEAFKKLVQDVIGVNVSEQFQKKATYLGQKGLLFKRRVPCPLGDDADIGLCSLFEPDPEPEKIPQPTEVESVNGHAEMGQDGHAEMGQTVMGLDGHAEMGQDGHAEMGQEGQGEMGQEGQAEMGQEGQTEVGQATPVTEGQTPVMGAVIGNQIADEENMERSEAVNGTTEVGQATNGPATKDQQPEADENMDGSEEQIET